MNDNKKAERKADLSGVGLERKTVDYFADNQTAFSFSHYTEDLESIQSILTRAFPHLKTKSVQRFDWKRQKPGRIGI